jgi:hypothetical protein
MIPYLALLPVGVIGMAGRLDRHPPDCVIGMRRNQRSFSPEYASNSLLVWRTACFTASDNAVPWQ